MSELGEQLRIYAKHLDGNHDECKKCAPKVNPQCPVHGDSTQDKKETNNEAR